MSDGTSVPPEPGDVGSNACPSADDECSVKVKTESRDCLICSNRIEDQWHDVYWTETHRGHAPLVAYICRVAQVRLAGDPEPAGDVACGPCVELVNSLERAELEFLRLRESFTAIVADSPAFESVSADLKELVVELVKQEGVEAEGRRRDSDDEPLAARKKRGRKPARRRRDAPEEGEQPEEPAVVKHEEELLVRRHSQRLPSLDLEDETQLSHRSDDMEWNPDDNPEPEDNDPAPVTKRSKRKSRSIVNGKRHRHSGPKANTKRVSIPVLGDMPSHLVVKGFGEMSECLGPKAKLKDTEEARERKRRKQKSQSKTVYPCSKCTAKFNSPSRLKFHMAKHEANKAPFICEICGAHYKHKKACDIHVAMHKGISDWKCEECNKLFPSKGALHRHNAIHTGKPNYQCDLCGKSFIHTSSFKMHKLSHTGLKPHACDVCGLALMTRSHLKRHKRIHSGEKRHECVVCGKKFSERYNLLAHQKSHEVSTAASTAVPQGPAMRKPWQGFRCHLCDRRFERRYMLEKHMEVVHQRIMEKGPPRPRNTMTKLLKAQAAAGTGKPPPVADAAVEKGSDEQDAPPVDGRGTDVKPLPTSEPPMPSPRVDKDPLKTNAERAVPASRIAESFNGAWAAAPYLAGEYGMRPPDYSH